MKRSTAVCLFVFALTVNTLASTYYVSPNGNDGNRGTFDEPWRTISMAARTLEPGDTVLIREGTYREAVNPARSGTPEEPIVYASFPDERVTVTCSNVVTDWERDDDGNRYRTPVNFTPYPRFNGERDPRGNRGGLVLQNGAKMNYAMEENAEDVDEPGEYYMDDSGNPPHTLFVVVRDRWEGFDPNNYVMEVGRVNHVFNLDGGEDYIIIKGIEIRGGNDSGISAFNSTGCIYDGLDLHSHYITGIYLKQGTEHSEIRNCEFWDNGHGGIELANSHSNWIHHNLFLSRDQGDGLGGNGAHMWLGPVGLSANDNIIEYNVGLRTGSDYILSCFVAVQGSRNIIRHNSVVDYHMAGIALLGGSGNIIENNIIRRTFGPCINVFSDAVEGGGHIIRYNDFFSNGIQTSFGWDGQFYDSLEEWEEVSGQDRNIDDDPLYSDRFNGDLRLTADSPCIDAGDPEDPPDPDGTRTDMGAFYFHQRDIEVEPMVLEFPPIHWGELDSLSFTIRNVGGTPLTIVGIHECEHISCIYLLESGYFDPPLIIEPNMDHVVWAYYRPRENLSRERGFFIESNDPDEPEVMVEAFGDVAAVGNDIRRQSAAFAITSTHPNPFNEGTILTYTVPATGNVSLTIFDGRGREVASLADRIHQPGVYEAVFLAKDLANGIYFARLRSQDESRIMKLALLR